MTKRSPAGQGKPQLSANPALNWLVQQTALDYFSQLVADSASFSLTEAAISLGQDTDPDLDVLACLNELDAMSRMLASRVASSARPEAKLHALTLYVYRELKFSANANDFFNPGNSFIHRVLQTRRGIPISLAVLVLELAQGLGLKASGVSFPGHFLLRFKLSARDVLMDPCTGQQFSRESLENWAQAEGILSASDPPSRLAQLLKPAHSREIIARMLRNLQAIYHTSGLWPALLQIQERLLALEPQQTQHLRDRAEVFIELGQPQLARHDFERYLALSPNAPDAGAISARIEALKQKAP